MPEARIAVPRRIGGEMYAWSDWDPDRGGRVTRSGALARLVSELGAPGRSVLIAGPHHDDVAASVMEHGSDVTWLVRSLSDAERLATRFPFVAVLCGDIAKLERPGGFDVVIAVGGLDRLASVEGRQFARDAVPMLLDLVAPGGVAALLYDNPFGVHHWVDLTPGRHYRRDNEWYPRPDQDDAAPASLARIDELIARDGFEPLAAYAVYPSPDAPLVLIDRAQLGNTSSPMRGAVGTVLSRAFTDAFRDVPLVADPRRLVARAMSAGAEGVVAPGWLVIARRGGAATAPAHAVVVGEVHDRHTYELSVVDGEPRLQVLTAPDAGPADAVLRRVDPSAHAVPAGRVFEDELFQRAAAADLPGLRAELARFVDWLEAHQQGGAIAGAVALCTPGDVLDDGVNLRLALPRWEPVAPVPADVVVAHALRAFAIRLITGNRPHPWPLTSDAAQLTSTMAAMLGRTLGAGTLRAAVELDTAHRAADERADPARDEGTLDPPAEAPRIPAADIAGYRELVDAWWRQEYELRHLRETLAWTERVIRSRDLVLSRLDHEIQLYSSSPTRKVVVFLRMVYRSLRRDARSVARLVRRRAAKGEMQ
jgi:SAM-dependent methyltransferase